MKNFLFAAIYLGLMLSVNSLQAQSYEMPIYTATSSRISQPGQEVSKLIDDDDNTIYHTLWTQNGIPDTLDFYMNSGVSAVNKIEYTPRTSGPNGIWTTINVFYSTVAQPAIFVKVNAAPIALALNNVKKSYVFPATVNAPYRIRITVVQASGNFSSGNELRIYGPSPYTAPSSSCTIPGSPDNALQSNRLLTVSSATASSFQSGENISRSYDGDVNTLYHSNYAGGGFPITLTYNFQNVSKMDYLTYIPRQQGDNGNYDQVEIYYSTTAAPGTFVKLLNADFNYEGNVQQVNFPSTLINPAAIRIRVLSGKNNFANCAEMRFYQKSTPVYSTLFNTALYSTLKPGVTQANIDTISSPFYKSLAQCLFNGTYPLGERVRTYAAYPVPSTVTSTLKIRNFSFYENPTDIVFAGNTTAVIFVDIPLNSMLLPQLVIRDFATESNTPGSTYPLQQGINTIDVTNGGLGYISYYTNNTAVQPVNVNIVSGELNGIFEYGNSTNTDCIRFLQRTTYPKLDILGQYVQLNFDKSALKENQALDGISLVKMYDSINFSERSLMGLDKFNRLPKNHLFAYTASSGGWHAGTIGVHFDLSWGTPNTTSVQGVDLWGVPHELGHINQVLPFTWVGTTEVSNNIYSLWVSYNMDRQKRPYT